MIRRLLAAAALAVALVALPAPAAAQVSRADSAQVLLESARQLQGAGRARAAEDILRLIIQRYPDTEAAAQARARLNAAIRIGEAGGGNAGFIASNTLYGSFLGIAVPAAFDAHDAEAYGVGLLVGAPLGFFASKAYANKHQLTPGQAGVASFATWWGAWQGLGWQEALHIGEEERCDTFGGFTNCYREDSETAHWAAMVIGSAAGLATGLIATNGPISDGTSALITNSALWGTFYGTMLTGIIDPDDGDALVPALLAGNAALIAAIPAAKAWNPRASRVRLISAAGLLGGVVGLGLDLLIQPDDDRTLILIPTLGATAGLIAGAALSNNPGSALGGAFDRGPIQHSVVSLGEKTSFGIPLPMPTAVEVRDARGHSTRKLGLQLNLVSGSF